MKLSRLETLILAGIVSVLCLAATILVAVVYYSSAIPPSAASVPQAPPSSTQPPGDAAALQILPTEAIPTSTPTPASTSAAAQPPTPSPSPTTVLGTFDNPVPLGLPFTIPGLGSLTVTSTQWVPGQTGFAISQLTFTCERPPSQICDTAHFMLNAVGSSGNGYAREFDTAIPGPSFGDIFDGDLYGGATESGNVGFLVTNTEQSLLMSVEIFLKIEDPTIFFRVSP